MADTWKNYEQTMASERLGNKKKNASNNILKKEEVNIQQMSADVSSKVQKYFWI